MKIGETIYVTDRRDWRAWLEDHYSEKEEIWLIFYKKAAGRPNIAYNDAVEEALCFGWIDSIRKTRDAESLAHRFTPRKAGSGYSQPNRERLRRMMARGQVVDDLEDEIDTMLAEPFVYPPDIIQALKQHKAAWAFFKNCAGAYQRIRVAYVDDGRKRPGEFEKRLANLVKKCEQGKHFGYGIDTFYKVEE